MAIKPLTQPKQFDEAKLNSMIEPLTVRVEKLRNGGRHVIPLPQSEESPDQPGGMNYDKDAVRTLEQYLVTEWSGGGIYNIKVTDAQNQSMEWISTWPVAEYPEKVPPPLQGVFTPQLAQSTPRRNPQVPPFPQGFPSFPQQPQYTQQQPYGYPQQGYPQQYYPPLPPPPPVGTPGYAMWSHEADKRSENSELARLREDNQRREREAIEARHKAELERERITNEQRFTKQDQSLVELRNMIAQLATTLQQTAVANNQPKSNTELELLKEQARQTNENLARERAERETERRERSAADAMKQMAENSQRQIDAMARQLEAFQASLAANNANKQDPMIEMLREQARQSAEAIKEISRSSSEALKQMQTSALQPRDILMLAKESTTAADQITDKLTGSFGKIIDLQQRVAESVMNMQPQGSPVVDMVREGLGNLKDMGERYFGRTELQARLEAEKQNQLVEAQRDIQIAQMQTQAGLGGIQPQQHVNGGPVITPIASRKPRKKIVEATEADKPQKKRLGRTDTEWFGPIEPNVKMLREGVADFLESIKLERTDAKGDPIGISPFDAARGITEGAQMVMQQQVNIPIMTDLLFPQRFGDFMDVMLPDVPEQYKADVLAILIPMLRGETGGGPGMTGEEKPEEASADDDADEDSTSNDDNQEADDASDGDPDDGDDAAQDGAEGPARATKLAVVKPEPIAPKPNGARPVNAPRRA